MSSKIYCYPTKKGVHSFYLIHEGEKIWLFNQAYKKSVNRYFRDGRTIDEALKAYKVRSRDGIQKDFALRKTAQKLPLYLRYVEKEYDIQVMEKTKRRAKDVKNESQ